MNSCEQPRSTATLKTAPRHTLKDMEMDSSFSSSSSPNGVAYPRRLCGLWRPKSSTLLLRPKCNSITTHVRVRESRERESRSVLLPARRFIHSGGFVIHLPSRALPSPGRVVVASLSRNAHRHTHNNSCFFSLFYIFKFRRHSVVDRLKVFFFFPSNSRTSACGQILLSLPFFSFFFFGGIYFLN